MVFSIDITCKECGDFPGDAAGSSGYNESTFVETMDALKHYGLADLGCATFATHGIHLCLLLWLLLNDSSTLTFVLVWVSVHRRVLERRRLLDRREPHNRWETHIRYVTFSAWHGMVN